MIAELRPAITMTLAMTLLTGLAYPLAITGIAQTLMPGTSGGSLVERGGRIVGSTLIGQGFARPEYLHGRPAAAGYDAAASTGTNLGPTNAGLVADVTARAALVAETDGVARPPADLVTSSGSGLDPHVSPASARLQAARIARSRGVAPEAVQAILDAATEGSGWLGEPGVNVLRANLALDAAHPVPNG